MVANSEEPGGSQCRSGKSPPSPSQRSHLDNPSTDDAIFIGGEFDSVAGVPRRHSAALEVGGSALSWNPDVQGGFVAAMALRDTTVYFAGSFSKVGNQPRTNLAAVSTATGGVTSWNPNVPTPVYTLALSDALVFVTGYFPWLNGLCSWKGAMAIDRATAEQIDWFPENLCGAVALALDGSTLYVGGSLMNQSGLQVLRNGVAFDIATGAALPWGPSLDNTNGVGVQRHRVLRNVHTSGWGFRAPSQQSIAGAASCRLATLSMGRERLGNGPIVAPMRHSRVTGSEAGLAAFDGGQRVTSWARQGLEARTPNSSGQDTTVYIGGSFTCGRQAWVGMARSRRNRVSCRGSNLKGLRQWIRASPGSLLR